MIKETNPTNELDNFNIPRQFTLEKVLHKDLPSQNVIPPMPAPIKVTTPIGSQKDIPVPVNKIEQVPTTLPDYLPLDQTIFYFFINPKSGSKQGGKLLQAFERSFAYEFKHSNPSEKFHFVNYKSGDMETELKISNKVYNPNKKSLTVKMANLFEENEREALFKTVAKQSYEVKPVSSDISDQSSKSKHQLYVFACGGDGTTTWIIDSLQKHKANFNNLIISLLPLGTGNDFNNALNLSRKHSFQ